MNHRFLLHIFRNPSTCIPHFLPFVSCLDVYRAIRGAFWCNLWIHPPLFSCVICHLIWNQQKLQWPTTALFGLFSTSQYFQSRLAAVTFTTGIIKQRTMSELSFNGLQVPLSHTAECASSRPGICKNNTEKMRVFLFIVPKCSLQASSEKRIEFNWGKYANKKPFTALFPLYYSGLLTAVTIMCIFSF